MDLDVAAKAWREISDFAAGAGATVWSKNSAEGLEQRFSIDFNREWSKVELEIVAMVEASPENKMFCQCMRSMERVDKSKGSGVIDAWVGR